MSIHWTERDAIYGRDGNACRYCGKNLIPCPHLRTLDHVIPKARGGSDSPRNLVTCCKRCNSKKGNLYAHEAGMTLIPIEGGPAYYGHVKAGFSNNLVKLWPGVEDVVECTHEIHPHIVDRMP